MTKPQILFYLNRTLRGLEEASSFNHEVAAKSGMSYSERNRLQEDGQAKRPEAEALREAIQLVESQMPDEGRAA